MGTFISSAGWMCTKRLKTPKGFSESQVGGEQTIKWSKERRTEHLSKTIDRKQKTDEYELKPEESAVSNSLAALVD
jgi:hypothetical protein